MRDAGVKQVVENVTENEGKIVVTTTISLERSVLEQVRGHVQPVRDPLETEPAARYASKAGIALSQIGPKTYLGVVDHRIRAHPLIIGETLFIFVPRHQALTSLADLVADIVREMARVPSWESNAEPLDTERILQMLAASGHYPIP
jgi:hypothetical protein